MAAATAFREKSSEELKDQADFSVPLGSTLAMAPRCTRSCTPLATSTLVVHPLFSFRDSQMLTSGFRSRVPPNHAATSSRDGVSAILLFTIEVKNRKHLADVMRRVRRLSVVNAVRRHPV